MMAGSCPRSGDPAIATLASYLLLVGVSSAGCGPGMIVDHEVITAGEANTGTSNRYSNSCAAVTTWLLRNEDSLTGYFEFYLPDQSIPEVEFEDRTVMLSFSQGCIIDGNELHLDQVRLDGDHLIVFETIEISDTGIEDGSFRPYTLSYIDLPWDTYYFYVDLEVDIVWPE